mgnify:FL=1
MNISEIFLIGVGLSMDAFAAAVCKGLNQKKFNIKNGFIIALFFGGFQALMPFLGWALGKQFEKYITSIDHWIAFVLLGFIGGKMIYEALTEKEETQESAVREILDLKEILVLSVATSIDALAVGITFAFLTVNIASSVTLIGLTTFVISFAGFIIGNKFGAKYQNKAELLGGIILVLIGFKILLEHTGLINF